MISFNEDAQYETSLDEGYELDGILQGNETVIDVAFADGESFESALSQESTFYATFVEAKHEEYSGAYTVVPKVSEQWLLTKDKVMRDDVNVKEIPYHEVSNPVGGTTVTIGG